MMGYQAHDIDLLKSFTRLELKNRQRTLSAELRDRKSTRTAEERIEMQQDLTAIEKILKDADNA